jgi:hypothetical protein
LGTSQVGNFDVANNQVKYDAYTDATKDQPLITDKVAKEVSKTIGLYNADYVYTGLRDSIAALETQQKNKHEMDTEITEAWRKAHLTFIMNPAFKEDAMTADKILELGKFQIGMDGLMTKIPSAGDNLKTKGTEAGQELVNGADSVINGLMTATNTAGQNTIKYSNTAATALRLGAEVGARFFTDAGNAVSIGMTKSGQEIAVIGQVAQRQFEQAGGQWVVKTDAAAVSHANIVGLSAEQFKGKMVEVQHQMH